MGEVNGKWVSDVTHLKDLLESTQIKLSDIFEVEYTEPLPIPQNRDNLFRAQLRLDPHKLAGFIECRTKFKSVDEKSDDILFYFDYI